MQQPLPYNFKKSSYSGGNDNNVDCVEVARQDGWVEIRDDKLKDTPAYATQALRFTDEEFDAYLVSVRKGADTMGLCLEVRRRDDGMYVFRRSDATTVELEFT